MKTDNHNFGFTLAEMLVAIGIIAAIVLIGLPFYQGLMQNLNLSSATRAMASDLRYAQQLSVTTQVNYSVIINPADNSYQIINAETGALVKAVNIKDNIDIESITDLQDNTVTFNATGAATSTGSIILNNASNKQATIEIKPSGYVKIQ